MLCSVVCVTEGHRACVQNRAVTLSAETDRSTIRTRDQVKRSGAQTVTSAEPLAVRTHLLGTGSKSGTPQH